VPLPQKNYQPPKYKLVIRGKKPSYYNTQRLALQMGANAVRRYGLKAVTLMTWSEAQQGYIIQ